MPTGSIVLIAGSPNPDQLLTTCEELLASGFDVQIVEDALLNRNQLTKVLFQLNDKAVKTVGINEVKGMVGAEHLVVSQYASAYLTATVAVILGGKSRWQRRKIRICWKRYSKPKLNLWDKLVLRLLDTARVLVIERKDEPDKGCKAIPGGFHAVNLESLEECGSREAGEEVGLEIQPSWLTLIDVRSGIRRDPRGHVVDHGYAWYVPADMEEAVKSSVTAGSDAASAQFESVAKLLSQELAFDHDELLRGAVGLH
jgi:8-oxo-dGTP diphosphatase